MLLYILLPGSVDVYLRIIPVSVDTTKSFGNARPGKHIIDGIELIFCYNFVSVIECILGTNSLLYKLFF